MTEQRSGQTFDLFKGLNTLRETVSRTIEDSISALSGTQLLPLDIYETETHIVIVAGPLSGIQPEQIDISVTGDTLTIKGETRPDLDVPEERFLRRERRFGAFARTIRLPQPVRADQADAEFKSGLLKIMLPKSEPPDPRVIGVRKVEV
ncbi:MAG: Hsp20/alpha crystallin family protein [Chloroflexi bacterium]|jgi:HSP20 family protein|nr:Hsp20/alpha crystallin family protein [Chloroflexota bacterium]